MTAPESAAAFAAFREAVLDDFHLAVRLRRFLDRDAFVAEVVSAGSARGFAFDGAAVLAALRDGEAAWCAPGDDPP